MCNEVKKVTKYKNIIVTAIGKRLYTSHSIKRFMMGFGRKPCLLIGR